MVVRNVWAVETGLSTRFFLAGIGEPLTLKEIENRH